MTNSIQSINLSNLQACICSKYNRGFDILKFNFLTINGRHILTSTDNKVKQLQKHSPFYNTCVKSNQLVLVIEVFSRKTHLFMLLQGSGNLLLFLFLFEMLEPLTKLFQLCIFFFKITLQSVDSSLFSFAMRAALSLPFLA